MKKFVEIIVCAVWGLAIAQASFAQEVYTLGVLAPKGTNIAKQEWQPTIEYLSHHTGNTFRLIPLRFKSAEPAVKSGKIDFLLCHPSFFFQMMEQYGITPLASLVGMYQGKPLRGLGAVIFTGADSDIQTLADVKGKKVAAPQRGGLMAYQLPIYVLKKKGLAAGKDFDVTFTGKLPLTVKAVKSGAVDAGFVRTGFLEWFERQGECKVSDFKVIEPELDEYPYQHNGPILPSFMFGAAKEIDAALARDVAAALKAMPDEGPAAKSANIYGWEDPANLALVREIVKTIQ